MKKLSFAAALGIGTVFAAPVWAACTNLSCEQLGYSSSLPANCDDYLLCPFDTSKKACTHYQDEWLDSCPAGKECEVKYVVAGQERPCRPGYTRTDLTGCRWYSTMADVVSSSGSAEATAVCANPNNTLHMVSYYVDYDNPDSTGCMKCEPVCCPGYKINNDAVNWEREPCVSDGSSCTSDEIEGTLLTGWISMGYFVNSERVCISKSLSPLPWSQTAQWTNPFAYWRNGCSGQFNCIVNVRADSHLYTGEDAGWGSIYGVSCAGHGTIDDCLIDGIRKISNTE